MPFIIFSRSESFCGSFGGAIASERWRASVGLAPSAWTYDAP